MMFFGRDEMNNEELVLLINRFIQSTDLVAQKSGRSAGYLARQEIDRLNNSLRSNPRRLELFGYKVYSQNDEDGILDEIFKRLGLVDGCFCEIGVENGLECNTLYLLHKGWRGVWLEGDERRKDFIEHKFSNLLSNHRLGLKIGYVTPNNINSQIYSSFKSMGCDPSDLDFLSIDIDGMDIYLLESLTFLPKVICIEYNAKFPPAVSKRPVYNSSLSWRGTDYMGSSLKAINQVAVEKGYCLVATNYVGANAFFVRRDLMNDRFDKDIALEDIYNPPRYYLYYDHYAKCVGHPADFGPYVDLMDFKSGRERAPGEIE
jgi:hypothetical protein